MEQDNDFNEKPIALLTVPIVHTNGNKQKRKIWCSSICSVCFQRIIRSKAFGAFDQLIEAKDLIIFSRLQSKL